MGSRVDAVVRELASHQCVPRSIPGPGVICGLSLLLALYSAPRGFFSGYSGFPLSSKTNIAKFQFDLDYSQVLCHEPLAWVIAQVLPVFGIKLAYTFTFFYPQAGAYSGFCTMKRLGIQPRSQGLSSYRPLRRERRGR